MVMVEPSQPTSTASRPIAAARTVVLLPSTTAIV